MSPDRPCNRNERRLIVVVYNLQKNIGEEKYKEGEYEEYEDKDQVFECHFSLTDHVCLPSRSV